MPNFLKPISTRFRAYQIGTPGSSFSYFADGKFTLIEGRITATSHASLVNELTLCDKQTVDTLHITGWDQDHCHRDELSWILSNLKPAKIEYPGYEPHTDSSEECLEKIGCYRTAQKNIGTLKHRVVLLIEP